MINKLQNIEVEKLFLIIGLIFGFAFLVINPPFQVCDENTHFYKVLYLTDGNFLPEKVDGNYGVYIPESATKSVNIFISLLFHPENKININNITSLLQTPLNSDDLTFKNISMAVIVTYSPIPYIWPSLFIFIGKLFNLSPIILMYLGRISNLFLYVIIVYLAIKITPVQKWVFLLLALMPMALYLGSSLSADSFTIAISILTIAMFFKLAFNPEIKEIKYRDISILVFLIILIGLSKSIYLPLSLLFLMIPSTKFRNRKKMVLMFVMMILPVVLITGLWSFFNIGFYVPRLDGVSVSGQISTIISNPVAFFLALMNSLLQYKIIYLTSFVGNFGWFDTPIPDYLAYTYLFTVIMVALVMNHDKNKVNVTIKQKIIALGIFLLISIIMFTLEYITWTKVGNDIIGGIQGRYFIPIAPLLFLLFYNDKIQISENKYPIIKGIIIILTIITLLISLYTIINRFYIP
jgi:uncharacterized membrane protein